MTVLRKTTRLSAPDRQAAIVAAACACLAEGGIRDFTVDKVIARAGVSRGLIGHHFGSMDGLLIAVYNSMYADWLAVLQQPRPGLSRLEGMIAAVVSPDLFSHPVQSAWLALWCEIATNPVLRAEHRKNYAAYRAHVLDALAAEDTLRGVDLEALTSALICLIDGFGVQRSVEPALMTEAGARAAIRLLLKHAARGG